MSAVIYPADAIPTGTSWIYLLDFQQAKEQCAILGIEPASTLELTRKLLREYVQLLPRTTVPPSTKAEDAPQIGGIPPLETNMTPVNPGQKATDLTQNPSLLLPDMTKIIQTTALAVGEQLAHAISGLRIQSTPASEDANMTPIFRDLLRDIPAASGALPHPLLRFLIAVHKVNLMSIVPPQTLLAGVLPKTSDPLRATWIKGVADRTPLPQLIVSVLDFYIPPRIRQSLIHSLIYRGQRPQESLADFIIDLQDVAGILMPDTSPSDLLEIALTGLNPATRACLAGFKPPATLQELKDFQPRIQAMSSVPHQAEAPITLPHQDRLPQRPSPSYGSYGRSAPRGNNGPQGGRGSHQRPTMYYQQPRTSQNSQHPGSYGRSSQRGYQSPPGNARGRAP